MNLTMFDPRLPVCRGFRGGFASRYLTAAVLAAAVSVLAGCGDSKDKAASQTAVKVNKDEITVHQINFVLQQQRGLKPDQTDAASRQILERLVDQQLTLQKGDELKIDRDPRVVQQLEAARREILSRAYLERIGESAIKPTAEEIKKYYDEKPNLFRDRRVYSIQEIAIESRPDQVADLREKLAAAKNINEFLEYLKAQNYRFNGNQAVRAAEQLPLNSLDAFARMKDGQAMLVPSANGVQVVLLASSRSQPVSEEQARPAIEQFLLNERKRKIVEDDIKALRAAAKVEYVGKFAEAASAPAGSASNPEASPGASTATSPLPAATPAATPQPAVVPAAATPPTPAASSGLSATDISKGMGLK